MKRFALFFSVLLLVCSSSLWAVTLTVSTAGGAGDFNSIQLAISSCLSNPDTPDVINILDNGPYYEALDIGTSGFDLTIQGSSGSRPVVVISAANANAGPFGATNRGIDIRVDTSTTVIKDLVFIPDVTNPPAKGIAIYPWSAISNYYVTLDNVVITANNGSDGPVTMDGLNLVSDATTFTDDVIELGGSSNPGHLVLNKVICSKATLGANDGLRVLMDGVSGNRATVDVGPGCVFSYIPEYGVYFGTSNYMSASLSGTSTNPIIITNNGKWGIWDYNNTGNSAITSLNWVIVANNADIGYRISGTSNPATITMTNCTFANNGKCAIDASPATGPITINASNVIIAGNGSFDGTTTNNINIGAQTFNATNSAIILQGTYALDTITDADGVVGAGTYTPTSVISANPFFASLDPANANFLSVQNDTFQTAGPGGTPLTGGGKFIGGVVPVELSAFTLE
jgi:hypothetical protein